MISIIMSSLYKDNTVRHPGAFAVNTSCCLQTDISRMYLVHSPTHSCHSSSNVIKLNLNASEYFCLNEKEDEGRPFLF